MATSVPKDKSRTPADTTRHSDRVIQLNKVLPKSTFDRINAERKDGRSHTFTTGELVDLVKKVADAQPSLDSTPDNAAESARRRQLELSRKRRRVQWRTGA